MRRKLAETLYSQPASLIAGSAAGVACAGAAMSVAESRLVDLAAGLLILTALLRVAVATWLSHRAGQRDARSIETIYEIGAFSYGLMVGALAATTLYVGAPAYAQVLTVAYAFAFGVGIAARNAGRPAVAIGQLLLATVPTAAWGLAAGGAGYALAAASVLIVFSVVSSTFDFFRTLREQIIVADTSALMAEKMRELARTDVVTELLNRDGLNEEAHRLLMQLPDERKLALFWLDLERFKEINDTLGHQAGDQVLAEAAKRIRRAAPGDAAISRFGGDEFIVVASVADRGEAEHLAQALDTEIAAPTRVAGRRIEICASMGVALLPDDGPDLDSLMQAADLALYHAKVGRREAACFFDRAMTRHLVRKKEIETDLRAAIQRDELSIFFQPIVDLETGRIRTFEALVRWFHPEKGELRPDEFIPVAEETGVIITLGNWITAQAARACARWPEDVTLAVNLSPVQIRAPGAALGILAALRDAQLDPRRLELEVTESLFIDDDAHTARFIEELAAAGVRFALDDFGTGYSSLGYINKFPFTKIKVDRSFVSGPNTGKNSDAIIRAVAEMGTTLGMDIVAEGLETLEQVQAVRDAGCTLGQGYYFSRAVPDYLAAMLLSQERRGCEAERLVAG